MSEEKFPPEDIDNSASELPFGSSPPTGINYKQLLSELTLELEEQHEKLDKAKARIRTLESVEHTNKILDDLIKPMANKIFWFMCSYCAFIGMLLLMSCHKLILPTTVLAILVGSTAVTVIGLVGTIVAGIFSGARRHA